MKVKALLSALFVLCLMLHARAALADGLVFVHSPGCFYCQEWREEVGGMYHKTLESKRLPLREVNLDHGMPDDLKHLLMPSFTPTFIVLDDQNREAGRIVGYSPDFFWGFLNKIIQEMDAKKTS